MHYALCIIPTNSDLCGRMRSLPLDTRNADNDNDNNKDNNIDNYIDNDIENAFFCFMRSHKNVQNLFKNCRKMFNTCSEL